ncbi:MAG: hypothetical protein ISS72_04860 [Candidatus Brocadiae bacterium]|nr:hypothetical protein [Candidatus Brocadiia bacterium]
MDAKFLQDGQTRKVRSERTKLILMVAALVVLIGGMVKLAQRMGERETVQGEPPEAVSKEITKEPPPVDLGSVGKKGSPLTVREEDLQGGFEFLTQDEVYKLISDQDTTLEYRPFLRLLYAVSQDKPDALKAEGKPAEWKTLWEQPDSMRAKPLEIRGRILRIWRTKLPETPLKLTDMWVYRIRAEGAPMDSHGHLYDVFAVEKLAGALRHDSVVVYARYLKPMIIEPESEKFLEDPDLHTAVCIAPRFEPLTYLAEPGLPQPIYDGTRPEARAFYYLLNRARKADFATVEAEALTTLTYLDFSNNPDKYRGKPVAITGELRRVVRMALPENILGAKDVYYGQVVDADRKMNTFYCVDIPDGIHLKDPVIVYGYFLKKWSYVSQGRQVLSSPVVVGTRLVLREYKRSYTLEIALGTVVTLTVVILLFAYLRERDHQQALSEARRQRQLAMLPENLNEVARRRAAQASGRDAPPEDVPPPS